ncbi:hypothetical protein BGX33_004232 [Mortierella sp. NVP41]|nr:hypothetical protein BGX33_004232 [Mortierella sp. NVP41]
MESILNINMDQTSNIQTLRERHDDPNWEAMHAQHRNNNNSDKMKHHGQKKNDHHPTHHSSNKNHKGSHKGGAHHQNDTWQDQKRSPHHGNHGDHGKDGDKEIKDGEQPAKDRHPDNGEEPAKGKHPEKGERPNDDKKKAEGKDKKAKEGSDGEKKRGDKGDEKDTAKKGGEKGTSAKDGDDKDATGKKHGDEKDTTGKKEGDEKGNGKGHEKNGRDGGADKAKEDKKDQEKEPQDSKQPHSPLSGTKTEPTIKAPLDTTATPSQSDGQAAVPGSPFFTSAGPSIPGAPSRPLGNSGTSKSIVSPPTGHNDGNDNNKDSTVKILTYTLIPLTLIAGAIYGVVAYRRALRRRLQEDAEAAATLAATRPPTAASNSDDDSSSLMSAVSYRPPAPFASEVDVTTETMETTSSSNPEIVIGDGSQHLIAAPKRDEFRTGDYEDYSHVCQSQILGKKCSNNSISCFVALNHSNGGLNAMATPRTPSAPGSRVLIPMMESTANAEFIGHILVLVGILLQ